MERLNKYDLDKKFIEKRLKEVKKVYGRNYGSPGRYRKQHPMDCGKPGCLICHYSKVYNQKTHKQEIEDLRFQEQLND